MQRFFKTQLNLLLIAGLLFGQLGLIVHATELEEHADEIFCGICFHNLSDKTTVDAANHIDVESFHFITDSTTVEFHLPNIVSAFQARAPPLPFAV